MMKKISAIALIMAVWILGNCRFGVTQAASSSQRRSFKQWCIQQDSLSDEAKKTVAVLLNKAGTNNCEQADHNLSSRTQLNLRIQNITDIRFNQITDISSLSGLTNLMRLYLEGNPIIPPTCPSTYSYICFWGNSDEE
ncbi:MAG: leucine-rich repeat domain-containing protein [Coleofasciculus chthonoplastes F3-SA18-01]|uniref:hypothetical protein n=1 Tax=Coleofasciculus chthonoplastes TaxID=64178 RepID=UPI0032F81F9D